MDVMTLAAKLTLNTAEFDSKLNNSEQEMKGLGAGGVALGGIITRAVTAAGKALANFGKQTVQVGMDFDAQMSQVKALGQLTDTEFVKVRKRAMDLGASTKFTATQVGEAFSYMALAGWNTDEMLEGIGGVLDLAAASGEDLGRTSDIVTDALTAFGLGAEDSAHFVNVLAAASTNSNTTVGQMGEAFKYLATTGGMLGYSIDDVATALGLLANNGIKAGQAGTSMRQILNTLVNPSKDAAAAMEALGVSLFDSETNARKPLAQVIQELRDIYKEADFDLEGFSPEEIQERIAHVTEYYAAERAKIENGIGTEAAKKAALKERYDAEEEALEELLHPNETFLGRLGSIGGLRGISSLFALMMATDEDLGQLTGAIGAADEDQGAAAQMAETMLDNLQGDITILNSAMEGLRIVVSDSFKEQLRSFVQTLTEQIGNLNEAFQQDGVLGMFVNLANWVVDGVGEALENPNEQQIIDFGNAIGTFMGKLAAKIVTNLPTMLEGVMAIGSSLAEGLITGIFSGLLGSDSEVQALVDGLNKELNNVEINNVKAVGLLNYLEELAAAGDENVTKTDAWETAVEQLEAIMPGVKDILENEGDTLQSNIDKVRTMTSEIRKQALQQAMVNTLQKQYELLAQQSVEREQQRATIGVKQGEQKAIRQQFLENIQRYAALIGGGIQSGQYGDMSGYMAKAVQDIQNGGYFIGNDFVNFADMTGEQLAGVLTDLTNYLTGKDNVWETDQEYLSPEEINRLNSQYSEANDQIAQANAAIDGINAEMDATKGEIATTEKAVENVTAELNGTATGVDAAGAAVVSALYGAASGIGSAGGAGDTETDGSFASGLDYVPYDGFTAELHRGEAVLTRSQADSYRGGGMDTNAIANAIAAAVARSISGLGVYMDGEAVGELVAPTVNSALGDAAQSDRYSRT